MKRSAHDYTEFGKQVKIVMITLNLNNRTLAEKLGYKESTLCDVLKGRNQSSWRIEHIQEVLSCMQNTDGSSSVFSDEK